MCWTVRRVWGPGYKNYFPNAIFIKISEIERDGTGLHRYEPYGDSYRRHVIMQRTTAE